MKSDQKGQKFRQIILIDDDDVTNFVNRELFIELKIARDVISFEHALLALAYLKSEKFNNGQAENNSKDLILLDINMPEMNGFEFLEKFRKIQTPGKIVILVTLGTNLNKDDEDMMNSYKDVVSGFIEKPLTRENIIGIVNHYL
jgi:CheY-like chemotaxis protein